MTAYLTKLISPSLSMDSRLCLKLGIVITCLYHLNHDQSGMYFLTSGNAGGYMSISLILNKNRRMSGCRAIIKSAHALCPCTFYGGVLFSKCSAFFYELKYHSNMATILIIISLVLCPREVTAAGAHRFSV